MNLIAAAIIGIAVIVLLIAACKVHPFLSLLAGSFVMAVCAGVPFDKAFDSFTSGVGGTISNVGLLIAFGSIIGTILFKSGGADTIVDTIMAKTPLQRLPWAMALIAFIVGIPMFFEVGVVILIPVVLFAARRSKSPVVLLITTVFAMVALGYMQKFSRDAVNGMVGQSFGSVAGIILIVAAGGGFKQTLVDSGIGDVIANSITESAMNPLIAGWLVAVLIRLATGSATVATVTASGIMVPLAAGMSPTHLALLVLAIGAGSVFFSHLNDAGFWLVKEYFGMSVGQTLKTWSLMETILSVVGLGCVMLLSLVL